MKTPFPQPTSKIELTSPGSHSEASLARQSGVTAGGWSTGCGFADYDRDGDLDLFVSRYVKLDLEHLPEFGKGGAGMVKGSTGRGADCQYRGVAVQCGPRGLPGEGDLLFRNDGHGRFEEVGQQAGVSDPHHYFGLGVAWFDADEDGWLDLFVANDAGPNFLYMNQKDGTFKESAFPAGVAVSEDGAEQGCMGVGIGDYENAGRFSIFVTNFAEEYNAFYRNVGTYFTDWSFRTKTAPSSLPFVGWGARVPRLRQRRLAGHHRRQRPRLPAARPGQAGGVRPLPAAAAALPQPRRRDLRRGGSAVRPRAQRAAGEPRTNAGRSRQRRPDGRRDRRPRRLPPGAAQRARGRGELAPREAPGQAEEHERGGGGGDAEGGRPDDEAPRAQRDRLHLPGRQAPALRPRRGDEGRLGRGALARPDEDAPGERQGERGSGDPAGVRENLSRPRRRRPLTSSWTSRRSS